MSRIEKAFELNNEINAKKKELDKIKAEIKAQGVGSYDGESCVARVEDRVTSYVNEAKALEVVKRIGAKWLIKETVDTDKLEDAIASGEIDASEFVGCLVEKHTSVLTFKKR